ncbi:hypothetical protein Glove_168g251 [Diversispora epigaea]|uniref:Uncharacterized protein n=1 Tax=Diversispora epigaea TaxID=1348612 RepID=A0A397IZI8_9GLOM|nr:hypothetical protein Glove_168g251 [Diversispora epigaea]
MSFHEVATTNEAYTCSRTERIMYMGGMDGMGVMGRIVQAIESRIGTVTTHIQVK